MAANIASFASARAAALASTVAEAVAQTNVSGSLAIVVRVSQEAITQTLPEAFENGTKWAVINPGTAAVCAVAGVGIVLVAAPGAVAAAGLGALGFGPGGVVAGSVAAGVQSGIGSIVAPSIFATLTSAGAGGYGVATVLTGVQTLGSITVASAGGLAAWMSSISTEES